MCIYMNIYIHIYTCLLLATAACNRLPFIWKCLSVQACASHAQLERTRPLPRDETKKSKSNSTPKYRRIHTERAQNKVLLNLRSFRVLACALTDGLHQLARLVA